MLGTLKDAIVKRVSKPSSINQPTVMKSLRNAQSRIKREAQRYHPFVPNEEQAYPQKDPLHTGIILYAL